MYDDDSFLSMISPYASVDLNTREFSVSDPVALDGVNTAISIIHRRANTVNQKRTITYRRFDLNNAAFTIKQSLTTRTVGELIKQLDHINMFKYRVVKNAKVEPRFIKLKPEYFVDDVVPILQVGTTITVQAKPQCKWFIGSIKLTITA